MNTSLSARIRRRNHANNNGEVGTVSATHQTYLPREHYGHLPVSRPPVYERDKKGRIKYDKKGNPVLHKNKHGEVVRHTSRTAHILTMAAAYFPYLRHLGSIPLHVLSRRVGHAANTFGKVRIEE